MTYPPDPGNIFISDAHRRVMAHLPNPDDDPITVEGLIVERINRDQHTLQHFKTAEDVAHVLKDLQADGHAKHLKGGWKNTPDGFEALIGPPNNIASSNNTATIGLDPATLGGTG